MKEIVKNGRDIIILYEELLNKFSKYFNKKIISVALGYNNEIEIYMEDCKFKMFRIEIAKLTSGKLYKDIFNFSVYPKVNPNILKWAIESTIGTHEPKNSYLPYGNLFPELLEIMNANNENYKIKSKLWEIQINDGIKSYYINGEYNKNKDCKNLIIGNLPVSQEYRTYGSGEPTSVLCSNLYNKSVPINFCKDCSLLIECKKMDDEFTHKITCGLISIGLNRI